MGFGAKELIIILVIVLVIFGSKKLTAMGKDLGKAIKDFKKEMKEVEDDSGEIQNKSETFN